MDERADTFSLLLADVKPDDTTWSNLRKEHIGQCIRFLMDKVKFIHRTVRCRKCGNCVTYNPTIQKYRCSRRSCRKELSWTHGTCFYNLKGGTCAHMVAFFGELLIYEDGINLSQTSGNLAVSETLLEEWSNYLLRVLDFWKSSLQPSLDLTADKIQSSSGFQLFVETVTLENRVSSFFSILKNFTRYNNEDYPQEYIVEPSSIEEEYVEIEASPMQVIGSSGAKQQSPVNVSNESKIERLQIRIMSLEKRMEDLERVIYKK